MPQTAANDKNVNDKTSEKRVPARARTGNGAAGSASRDGRASAPAARNGRRGAGRGPRRPLDVLAALEALAAGDFSVRLPYRAGGADARVAVVFNAVAAANDRLARELRSVSNAVGRRGDLRERVDLGPVRGEWRECADAVNSLVEDLVQPTTEVARVIEAVARGDLTKKVTADVRGEVLRLKQTINTMVDQLRGFASEVTRVAREVGTEGKLGGQAKVEGVAGTWKDLTENVNSMAANLTSQVRNIAEVTTAVARGDLSKKITVEVRGEILELKNTVNTMVDRLKAFSSEVTRVAREVGTEGKLGGQAKVEGVAGTWKDLTENVNSMAENLTSQVRNIAEVTTAVARGDLSKKITVEVRGEILRLKNTINTMVDRLNAFASEVTRVAREVGTEGKLGGQAKVPGVAGTWKDLTDNVNSMAENLTSQVRNIADVTTAVANGDLSKKITVEVRGEILRLKSTVNTMVDQLNAFASEVTRVAREVGTEGKLGGQAKVKGVAGTWKDLTENVNSMAANLTAQVRNIAEVTTAVARGDLSKKITVEVKGEILELKNTINTMVDRLKAFSSEVTRVAREVGTEGKLGGQAKVEGVAGTWKDLTENVNSMAANLTSQVRNIAEVTTAVARGDLSKKITVDVEGEILELKNTINTMVDQLNAFASEVTRVAREVGTEGKLGGQAKVKGVAGTWKDLTDNVNSMADNLTTQVRNIAEVTTAVARGDLSKKITVEVRGEIAELKNTINTMVDRLQAFSSEVTRVAREVGTEGRLGGQARVEGVAGTWKDLTENVNSMADNLTNQVRNIAEVTTAVANGDLSKKVTVEVRGEILRLKDTINTMVDQLNAFASEVTRVAREVGTEGKLGGQAHVRGVAGTWKDLTDNVNSMADNLTSQVRNIAEVTTAVANGDLSKKITVEVKGEILELKNTVNTMVDQLNAFASEVTRVAREVGTEGKLGGQAHVRGVAGTWKDLTDNVNSMAENLTSQVRNIADVTTAVANGDLSRKITVEVRGEIAELKDTINTMVDRLNAFASEVTRVAREVGTEGNLGGQAHVPGVAGIWKDLTDNVNTMAENLTAQVRGIATVVTGVANGELNRPLVLEAKGEIAVLADTINEMIRTLAVFADQVTTVAREVGVEGRLGGQAQVPGAAGTWRDLTDNVNQLAANLTTQVRAINEVASAVTQGDLTRSIAVEARGEVAALKDALNEMIRNLKETTQKSNEQDWLNSNLARFGRILQGQRDLQAVARMILSELAKLVTAQHGVFYVHDAPRGADRDAKAKLTLLSSYAFTERKTLANHFDVGEGLVGQCALEKNRILLTNVPADYVRIRSGLGDAAPLNIIVLPILFEGEVKAVIELASFDRFSPVQVAFLEQLAETVGIVLTTIDATMRTEDLLRQSQSLTERLRAQQQELQQTNEELQEKARLLTEQKAQVEVKNREVELARQALEEKAEQLSLTSRYKSEFLANMSHELRTPLNSLLILARLLTENPDGNLSAKQVEYAETIHVAGRDLLALINEILDLSKIESGTMVVDATDVHVEPLTDGLFRSFHQIAADKGLEFEVKIAPDAPPSVLTDGKRLQQVLRNLLANAFKFTDQGSVVLAVAPATGGWSHDHPSLSKADGVVAFSVIDTGIGIPKDKHQIVFEAFQQADGTTSRRYGGTGLGLSISRELARILGGEIRLESEPGKGSTFTLYLPRRFAGAAAAPPLPGRTARPPRSKEEREALVHGAGADADVVPFDDDRKDVKPGDQSILIVEDDPTFAKILLDLARERGFKGLVAQRGEWAIAMAKTYQPKAITLDMHLPGMDGWTVLDRLKHDPLTSHVPVHVISVVPDRSRTIAAGALAYVGKPATREELLGALSSIRSFLDRDPKRLLIVSADEAQRHEIVSLVGDGDVDTTAVASGAEALVALREGRFDCVVLDLDLPGEDAQDLLGRLQKDPAAADVPVVALAKRSPSKAEKRKLKGVATLVVKGDAAVERVLSETTKFLHRVQTNLPPETRRRLHDAEESDPALSGKKVLVVDDDVRNVFALTGLLERRKMQVAYAENGREAIEKLRATPDVDVVLMDIMMPEMDGYEAMRAIRGEAKWKELPIIALTAKAMRGDREKCIEAGASDYVSKPVDQDQLLSLLRVWLHR
jgi:HAMP domain-containing protein/signal transduction histidine kinase/DNA-binding response OmpR family regulator